MTTLTTIILIVSVWLFVVLFLCALVHNGAIREREEYERPLASRKRKAQARRPVTRDDADSAHADSPEIHGPSGRKRTP
jgi:hypothetical protein